MNTRKDTNLFGGTRVRRSFALWHMDQQKYEALQKINQQSRVTIFWRIKMARSWLEFLGT